jgi:hypothetical protein
MAIVMVLVRTIALGVRASGLPAAALPPRWPHIPADADRQP